MSSEGFQGKAFASILLYNLAQFRCGIWRVFVVQFSALPHSTSWMTFEPPEVLHPAVAALPV